MKGIEVVLWYLLAREAEREELEWEELEWEELEREGTAEEAPIPLTIHVPTAKMSTPAASDINAKNNPRGGRKTGNVNYSKTEVIDLMTMIRDRTPKSSEEWQQIAKLHNVKYHPFCRSLKSIKDTYGKLWKWKVPTGNPKIPDEVRLAKEAFRAIGKNAKDNNGGGHKTGTANYSKTEVIDLMTMIRDRAPRSSEEWQQIAKLHNVKHPRGRNAKSIKDTYGKLRKLKTPTGNPKIPDEARLAKEAFRAISNAAELNDFHGDDSHGETE